MEQRAGRCMRRDPKCAYDGWRDRARQTLCDAADQFRLCRSAVRPFSGILPRPPLRVRRSHCRDTPRTTSRVLACRTRLESKLGQGQSSPRRRGADFNRLGIDFWTEVYALDARNQRRREQLQELVDWRNAIAHQDFDPVAPGGIPTLHLARVREWRRAVSELARSFDQAMYNYLTALLGSAPW